MHHVVALVRAVDSLLIAPDFLKAPPVGAFFVSDSECLAYVL